MSDLTNEDRAGRAFLALGAYATATRGHVNWDDKEDLGTLVQDLVTDLLHVCDQEKLDFDQLLEWGRGNHRDEVAEEASEEQ